MISVFINLTEGQNHLDATLERQVIPVNSEEGTFFLNVILPMAYSKLYAKFVLTRWRRWLQFCGSESNSLLDPVFFFV